MQAHDDKVRQAIEATRLAVSEIADLVLFHDKNAENQWPVQQAVRDMDHCVGALRSAPVEPQSEPLHTRYRRYGTVDEARAAERPEDGDDDRAIAANKAILDATIWLRPDERSIVVDSLRSLSEQLKEARARIDTVEESAAEDTRCINEWARKWQDVTAERHELAKKLEEAERERDKLAYLYKEARAALAGVAMSVCFRTPFGPDCGNCVACYARQKLARLGEPERETTE
jgi:hypothetical protein